MVSPVVEDSELRTFESVNWSRGAAYAVILLVVCTLFVLLMMRLFRVKLGEIGR